MPQVVVRLSFEYQQAAVFAPHGRQRLPGSRSVAGIRASTGPFNPVSNDSRTVTTDTFDTPINAPALSGVAI